MWVTSYLHFLLSLSHYSVGLRSGAFEGLKSTVSFNSQLYRLKVYFDHTRIGDC